MFRTEEFYSAADKGLTINKTEVLDYIRGFKCVIVWGAGNMGTALGRYLAENDIHVDGYWDQNFGTVKERNGANVYESFGAMPAHSKEETLIVCAIVNGTLSHKNQELRLKNAGYAHSLLGMNLYAGLICEMSADGGFDIARCVSSRECNFNTCQKYFNILGKESLGSEFRNAFKVVDLIVTRKCSLDCTYCGQNVGEVRDRHPEKYRVFPLEQIKNDLDAAMANIDIVGTLSIVGGEPFIHPQIDGIVRHALTKKNIGMIAVTTNGIYKCPDERLLRMKDRRVRLNFSDYTQSLSDKQRLIFDDNVAQAQRLGINVNSSIPVWGTFTDLKQVNPDTDESCYKRAKEICVFGPAIKDGKFFSCCVVEVLDASGSADVSEEILSLSDSPNLRQAIRELTGKAFSIACKIRCGNQVPGRQVRPGEQRKQANE